MQHINLLLFFVLCILNLNNNSNQFSFFYIVIGPAPIQIPSIIYTGDRMTLTCGPPSIQIGQISASEWTFNGQKIKKSTRFEITSGSISKLTVDNVILADIGKLVTPLELFFLFHYFEYAHD